MKRLLNKMYLGLLTGVVAPAFICFLIFLVKYAGTYSLMQIIEQIKTLGLGAKIVALIVFLANGVTFFITYRLRWDKFSKGVLFATFLYAFLVLSMKL